MLTISRAFCFLSAAARLSFSFSEGSGGGARGLLELGMVLVRVIFKGSLISIFEEPAFAAMASVGFGGGVVCGWGVEDVKAAKEGGG